MLFKGPVSARDKHSQLSVGIFIFRFGYTDCFDFHHLNAGCEFRASKDGVAIRATTVYYAVYFFWCASFGNVIAPI